MILCVVFIEGTPSLKRVMKTFNKREVVQVKLFNYRYYTLQTYLEWKICWRFSRNNSFNPANIHSFTVSNTNITKKCEIF